ncbi:LacI family DNA-binding transcriptional regulator [Spongiivirga citrea]|uniref:Substrate-binding domain-containing protein n=1 Tax=Spongiivirga citrea TaxID=1481457 RepID=A0A6M0CG84_9FLAO|nr:LacI family DNA-binding transcriptional regulator [Spongiivirga citrea]NER16916.1 substrate-binding domain-containing protein [Spongiivirga citrea]
MKRKMTLKQIARELDVSISTVSKALHDSKEISQDNRDRIQAFAKLYNYRPNNIALSLKNQKTKKIGVIIPEIVHHYFAKVISGIEKVANRRGYNVIIAVSNEAFDKEVINVDTLITANIDGFIMSISKETMLKQDYHHLKESINQGVPIVMFDRVVNEVACDKVIINDTEAARQGVLHLINSGCKNIVLVGTKDYINIGRLRTEGYIQALTENNIEVREELILKLEEAGDNIEEQQGVEARLNKIFDENPEIDGVFAVNEIYAITSLNLARNRGLSVPEDVSVVSFSNGVLSRHARPSLTTVNQQGEYMGEVSAEILIDKLEEVTSEEEFETRIIPTELLKRETTK